MPMRVLLIQPFGAFDGHYAPYTKFLAKGLLDAGHEVDVLSGDGFREDWPAAMSVASHRALQSGASTLRLSNAVFGRRWPAWVLRTFAAAWWAFSRSSEYAAIHWIDATWTAAVLLWAARGKPRNVTLTIASAPRRPERLTARAVARWVRETLDARALRYWLACGIEAIAHSEGVRSELFESRIACPGASKVHLIPWGVEFHEGLPSREEARRAIGYGGYEGDLFLCFGHVRPVKGIEELIAAVGQLRGTFQVVVAGACEPAYAQTLRNAARDAGCEARFDFRFGFVDSRKMPLYYRAADVAMVNYRHFAGASGVLSHAIEYRTPVIACDFGQIGAVVREERFGIVCNPGDVASLREALHEFLTTSPEERNRFCRQMTAFARAHCWTAVARDHAAVYGRADARPVPAASAKPDWKTNEQ